MKKQKIKKTVKKTTKKTVKKPAVKKKSVKKIPKKKAVKKKAIRKKAIRKKAIKKTKVIDVPKPEKNKVTKLKVWMMEQGINQRDLAKRASLSTNTINRLVNNGHATKSVVKLVSYEFGISVEQLMELLKFSEPIINEPVSL